MDYRKIFDTIPEEFDQWRPRYCGGLFAEFYAGIKDVILSFGDKITLYDKIELYFARKPL